jgi:MFS family permease
LVAAVLAMRLFDEWMSFLPAGAFEAFRSDLDLSYRDAATILTLTAVGGIAGSGFTVLADTHSRRAIATIGGYGYAASIATFGLGRSPWVLAIGAVGVGVFSTALVDAIEVAVVDVAGDHLESLLARINVGATVGDIIGPMVLAGIALAGGSWRVAFMVSAIIMAMFATLVAFAPIPPPQRDHDDGHTPFSATLARFRDPRVWWAGMLGAGLVALDESYLGFIIAGFERDRGTSRGVAVVLGSSSVLGTAASSLWHSRRTMVHAPLARMRAAAAAMAITALLFAVLPTLWLPTIAAFAFDVAMIGFWLPLQAMTLRFVPGRTGSTKAAIGAIEMLGLLIPIGIGAIADHAGLRAGLMAYAVVPATMTALCFVTFRARESE